MELSKDGQSTLLVQIKYNLIVIVLGMAGGWTPAVHLFTQSGGKLKFREEDQVFIPNKYPSKQISIGSCNGDFELDKIIKNSSNSLKDFLEINKTDYDDLSVELLQKKLVKKIFGYFHQIKLLEKLNHL